MKQEGLKGKGPKSIIRDSSSWWSIFYKRWKISEDTKDMPKKNKDKVTRFSFSYCNLLLPLFIDVTVLPLISWLSSNKVSTSYRSSRCGHVYSWTNIEASLLIWHALIFMDVTAVIGCDFIGIKSGTKSYDA
ncbi:hypothetical protein Tco_0485570 [Tanacetum coccineum]